MTHLTPNEEKKFQHVDEQLREMKRRLRVVEDRQKRLDNRVQHTLDKRSNR